MLLRSSASLDPFSRAARRRREGEQAPLISVTARTDAERAWTDLSGPWLSWEDEEDDGDYEDEEFEFDEGEDEGDDDDFFLDDDDDDEELDLDDEEEYLDDEEDFD